MVTNRMEEENTQTLDQRADRIRTVRDSYDSGGRLPDILDDSYNLKHHTPIEGPEKSGQTLRSLISDLDKLGPNKVLGTIVPSSGDLSYGTVRESFRLNADYFFRESAYSKVIDTTAKTLGIGGELLITGSALWFGATMPDDGPPPYSIIGAAVGLGSLSLIFPFGLVRTLLWQKEQVRANEESLNVPEEIKNRKKAFLKLRENAKEAEDFLRDYESLTERNI